MNFIEISVKCLKQWNLDLRGFKNLAGLLLLLASKVTYF